MTPVAVPVPEEETPTSTLDVENPDANEVRLILNLADLSTSKRTKAKAEKFAEATAELVKILAEEEEDRRAAEQNAAKLAEINRRRAEAARILEEADAEEERITGRPKKATGSKTETEASKVRAWAAEQGIEATTRGRISDDLMARYRAAHPGA